MNPVEPLAAPQRQHLRYLLEQGLPLASRPYRVLAERIGAGEDEVLEQVRRWDEDGLFRRFGRGSVDLPAAQLTALQNANNRPLAQGDLESDELASGWQLGIDGPVTRWTIEASLATLERPFTPCGVLWRGKRLPDGQWSYDAASQVLHAVVTGTGEAFDVRPDQTVTVAPDASLLELTPVTLLLHKPVGFEAGLGLPLCRVDAGADHRHEARLAARLAYRAL